MGERFYIGTAAWTIPKNACALFREEGSHLERYANRLNAVELNSSFYKEHKGVTYKRWGECTPENFVFSAKFPKAFTHEARLDVDPFLVRHILGGMLEMGRKFKVLLVQLPPSLEFDRAKATLCFQAIRETFSGSIICEPRHITWTRPEALALFRELKISKVMADPEPCEVEHASEWQCGDLVYYRMHGTPEMYRSKYSLERLHALAGEMRAWKDKDVWCIFDNTTFGYATEDAVTLSNILQGRDVNASTEGLDLQ